MTEVKPKGLSLRPVNVENKGQITSLMGKMKLEPQKKAKPAMVCRASVPVPESTARSSGRSPPPKSAESLPHTPQDLPPELPPKTKRSLSFSIPHFDENHEEKQREIEDIEQELARDLFKSPTYARDIYIYLQIVEKRWQIPKDFLDDSIITPKTRAVLMDWFIQVQVYLELLDTTLHLSVVLVDRFLSIQKVTPSSLQLLGITCILIAAKYYERFPPQVSDLVYLTDNTYKVKQVFTMERIVLTKFNFDLNSTDPVSTMEHFLQISGADRMMKDIAKYILDLTITSQKFACVLPTVLAAACVYTSRQICDTDRVWTHGLEHFSGYTSKDLMECSTDMLRMLIKAPTAKLQGARKKHAAITFNEISHNKLLETKATEILKSQGEDPADK